MGPCSYYWVSQFFQNCLTASRRRLRLHSSHTVASGLPLNAIPFNEGDSVGSLQLGRWHKPLACGHAEHRPEAYATETLASLNGIAVKRVLQPLNITKCPLWEGRSLGDGEARSLLSKFTTVQTVVL